MLVRFTKMHGLGNDFVVLDLLTQPLKLRPRHITKLADRRFGVGCDQVLVVEAPNNPDIDFRYRIYNADGSEVGQCGNGARCFARFVRDHKLTNKRKILVETASGTMELRVRDNNQVEVHMGAPQLEPAQIPLRADHRSDSYPLQLAGETLQIGAVSMGNPHAVLRVTDVDSGELERLGALIESHPDFPERTNAGFMQVLDESNIRLRVYERGVGETLACGSGACAAVVYGILRGWLQQTVTVSLPGGKLSVNWDGEGRQVIMTGPTASVFEGTIRL
jgi:diaminopimelate epimerase